MKSFIIAVTVLVLLVGGVILGSTVGVRRIEAYLDKLPGTDSSYALAEKSLGELAECVQEDLLLLNSLFPHDRTDALMTAIARAEAAAKTNDEVEYTILYAELRSILYEMERDLAPHLDDIV